jgi:FkbM family methyltransferase
VSWFFPFVYRAKAFWGKRVYVDLPENVSVLFFGAFPAFELPLTKFLIKNLKDDSVFYDVGAHIGFYTSLAKEFITSGEVHSFEPNPSTFRVLTKNGASFLNQVALSDKAGTRDFYADLKKMSGISGFSVNPKFQKITVQTTTLDDYVATHQPPTIIKIDTEGAEESVIRGGLKTFLSHSPTIIAEIWKDRDTSATVDLMFGMGYRLYGINKDGELELLKNTDHGANLSYDNFVFKK